VAELLGELARRVAGGDQRQHLLLALGQPRERGPAGRLGRDALEQVAEQPVLDHAGAVGGRRDGGGEDLGREVVLAQVADGAGPDGRQHRLVAAVGRADHHARAARLEHVGDEDVAQPDRRAEDHQVGAQQPVVRTRRVERARFGHGLHGGQGLEAGHESPPVDRV
jgi:hypothetical protein